MDGKEDFMKLKLESFENMAILVATETIQAEDCRILLAGVERLVELNRKWTLIDLSRAQLDSEAHAILVGSVKAGAPPEENSVQLHWLGGPTEFCRFESLDAILDEFNFKEFRDLSKKIDLQAQKESLEVLINARKRVRNLVEESKKEIPSIENEYITMNRNLRTAQSQLINRLLDPVYSDFAQISVLPSNEVEAIQFALCPTNTPTEAQNSEGDSHSNSSTLKNTFATRSRDGAVYNPHNLAQHIEALQSDLKALKAVAGEKFVDGADRAVSLLMENDIIRARIKEVRDVWLRQLEKDADINKVDFENGYVKFVHQDLKTQPNTPDPDRSKLLPKKAV